jgi:hypothetical protein
VMLCCAELCRAVCNVFMGSVTGVCYSRDTVGGSRTKDYTAEGCSDQPAIRARGTCVHLHHVGQVTAAYVCE